MISLSAWCRKKEDLTIYKYELKCFSDVVRFNKQNRKKGLSIVGFTHGHHILEKKIVTVTNDGTMYFLI